MAQSEPNPPPSPSTLKQKLKSTFSLFTSLRKHQNNPQPHRRPIRPHHHVTFSAPEKHQGADYEEDVISPPRETISSPKDRAKHFISRIGRRGHGHGHGHHRRHSMAADFRYDPTSYALNFDDGPVEKPIGDDSLKRSFSSRLPPSPTKDIGVSVR